MTTKSRRFLGPTMALAALLVGGCNSDRGQQAADVRTGAFVDAPVSGLGYAAGRTAGAETDTRGEFRYRAGDTIRFFIGGIQLGSVSGQAVVTPLDLVPSGAVDTPAVLNRSRLLLTLDADGDSRNGIQITAEQRLAARGVSLNFEQSAEDFARDAETFIRAAAPESANGVLVSAQTAQAELLDTLEEIKAHGGKPNELPQADAGAAQTVDEGATVQLAGSGQDADGTITAYHWQQLDGAPIELTGADTAAARFTAPEVNAETQLNLALVVTDSDGETSLASTVSITVRDVPDSNRVPEVDAGADQSVDEGSTVTLSGTASDPEGGTLRLRWQQIIKTNEPQVDLSGADGATAQFTAPQVNVNRTLSFRLSARDALDATGTDDVRVVVRNTPEQAPLPTLSVTDVQAPEGNSGSTPFNFAVTLSAASAAEVTVEYATQDDSALAGSDYTAIGGRLTFAPGESLKTITVGVAGDTAAEPDENFRLILSNPQNALLADGSAVGTIRNDDLAPPPCLPGQLCVGAAKRAVTPSAAHIQGLPEERYPGTQVRQKFHLGGYGFGPFEPVKLVADDTRVCDPAFGSDFCLTNAPAARAFHCENFADDGAGGCPAGTRKDQTWVRALYLTQQGGAQVLFLTLDAIGAGNIVQNEMKRRINAATGIPKNNILFGQTHTHAAADLQGLWGGVPQDWVQNTLYALATDAAKAAKAGARTATLTYASGQDGAYNDYRRPPVDASAKPDETLSVLQAKASDGTVLGTLVQYAAHPTSVTESAGCPDTNRNKKCDPAEDHGRAVHADYVLGLEDTLEAHTGGAPVLYYNGPIADARPAGGPGGSDAYESVYRRGECLAKSALHVLDASSATPCAGAALDAGSIRRSELGVALTTREATAELPVTNPLFLAVGLAGQFNRYYDFLQLPIAQIPVVGAQLAAQQSYLPQLTPLATTPVSRITIGANPQTGKGGLEIVTIPGEATNSFGQYIRALAQSQAQTDKVMLLGLTHNSFGYILPEEEFSLLDPGVRCAHADADPLCNSGFLLPFTGYEEYVSLGPLTAPLLRYRAYNPLFQVAPDDPRNLPPSLTACAADPNGRACLVARLIGRLDYVQRSLAQACRNPDDKSDTADGLPEDFCSLLDPELPGAQECHANLFLPESLCDVLGSGGDNADAALAADAARAAAAGCDILDPHYCLFPFPNDHFTLPDTGTDTGRRVNLDVAAMPRNIAGKPIDPTEWNRNDGFSPGQPIMLRVPGLDLGRSGTTPITDIARYADADAAIVVLDATTGERHPVWVELDANLTAFNPCNLPEDVHALLREVADLAGRRRDYDANVPPPPEDFRDACNSAGPAPDALANPPGSDPGPTLIIRPARNFLDGHRYVVALRRLKDSNGTAIEPGTAFQVCTGAAASSLTLVAQRCAQLRRNVFPVLDRAGIARDGALYLAWDFTVASTRNLAERLLHMRDDAFGALGSSVPTYTVTNVRNDVDGNTARRIEGTITVPSYLVFPDGPCDNPGPDAQQPPQMRDYCESLADAFQEGADSGAPGASELFGGAGDLLAVAREFIGTPLSRLHYQPSEDGRFGDGRPDRNPVLQEITVNYTCNIPHAAFAQPGTARATLYGHGLLGGQGEANGGSVMPFANAQNFMVCATDWIGMAARDVPTVASLLVDMSNFASLPDRAQQGLLNFLFLARLMQHPQGFAAQPDFQTAGQALFDHREVFYDGNSQGGIMGGALMAVAQDIRRGVLGVPGMNYSTLLQRSVDFDLYGSVFYAAYPNPVDQQFIIGLIQMLWDRAEANGYANHLTKGDYDFAGTQRDPQPTPAKQVLLHVAFGDHQVADVTAEVEARTIGAKLYTPTGSVRDAVETTRIRSEFNERPFFDLAPAVGGDPAESAMVIWDIGPLGNRYNEGTLIPPEDNRPPRAQGARDPHGDPRRDLKSWQQKSEFLKADGVFRNFCFAADGVTPRACFARKYKEAAARAGATPSPAEPQQTVVLDATASATEAENEGRATVYAWQQLGGPAVTLVDADAAVARFTMPALACDQSLVFGVTVRDGVFGDRAQVAVKQADNDCQSPGLLRALAQFMAELHDVITALLSGNPEDAGGRFAAAFMHLAANLSALPNDADDPGALLGLDRPADDAARRSISAAREVEPIVVTGAAIPTWSVPAATGVARPYPSGANLAQCPDQLPRERCAELSAAAAALPNAGAVRNAHNGVLLYPATPERAVHGKVTVSTIAAYAWKYGRWVEIPVQVDERMPYFLANGNSTFSIYSGTDPELSYVWDEESWGMTAGVCRKAYDTDPANNGVNEGIAAPMPDPIQGLDNDDEIVFMAADAGDAAPVNTPPPAGTQGDFVGQQIALGDPLDPLQKRYVYLYVKSGTPLYNADNGYVAYRRDANADQWIDNSFFAADDPEKLGTSNHGYGPNLTGTVCSDPDDPTTQRKSIARGLDSDGDRENGVADGDRFPRDGVTVTTPRYQWRASGRWMVREIHVAKPDGSGYGPDLIDRWKGRAFQQSPDSTISIVGFEDEQVNWEANSSLLGERRGPVRAIREVWGADSGTNVTKTETFYRDAVSYRYRVRVHPIPPDGLYTSWDYNRSAMVSPRTPGAEGRYYTALRPQGVPIDGINDDIGQIDGLWSPTGQCLTDKGPKPAVDGLCPMYFDAADATFNVPLAFANWEQISGKDDSGSLVYTFEMKSASALLTPMVVPYYRDDACLDDGTGDDPVARPYPGDAGSEAKVRDGYVKAAQARGKNITSYGELGCEDKQGAHASHGIHYFFTGDVDNAFSPLTVNEIDGQQWQFMVSTPRPQNVGEAYANVVRVPLQTVVTPFPSGSAAPGAAGNPDLADVCSSYGISAANPVCAQLRNLQQQCSDAEPQCSLAGGNLHALLDQCYERSGGDAQARQDGQPLAFCRSVDAFVLGAAAYCRQASNTSNEALRAEACALLGGTQVSERELRAFENSKAHAALRLQNHLGDALPLVHTSVVATHNSFNATDDNTPPTLSGSDYNQLYDVVGQLRMGVRAIELDVHWVPSKDAQEAQSTQLREPVVCHGRGADQMHAGCTSEKPLSDVLREIRAWLDGNPGEVVLLYVENHLSGSGGDASRPFDVAASRFEDALGPLVYRPGDTAANSSCPSSDGKYGSWLNVSRTDILGKGKQVLMFADECSGQDDASIRWDALFHKKTNGGNVNQYGSHVGARYPDQCIYSRAEYRTTWTRVWEDSTLVAAADVDDMADGRPPDARDNEGPITPAIARELMRCGMHMPSLDRLTPSDGRLQKMIWSWDVSATAPDQQEPSDAASRACAYQNTDGYFAAADCAEVRPFACVKLGAGGEQVDWRVNGAGVWDQATCPMGYDFAVPRNGYFNEKLKEAKPTPLPEVWLNYRRTATGWTPLVN